MDEIFIGRSKMRYLLVDLETTGLRDVDRVVELAMIFCEDGFERTEILANVATCLSLPAMPEDDGWLRHTAVRPADLVGQPSFADIAPFVLQLLLAADEYVGFGVAFDLRFLARELARLNIAMPIRPKIDIMSATGKMKLQEACEKFKVRLPLDIRWHRASSDLAATYLLWQKLRLRDSNLGEEGEAGSFVPGF